MTLTRLRGNVAAHPAPWGIALALGMTTAVYAGPSYWSGPAIVYRAAATLTFVAVLALLGTARTTGVLRFRPRHPGATLIILAALGLSDLVLIPATDSIETLPRFLVSAATEEVIFRGALLGLLVAAWGHTRRGLIAAIALSSLTFGAIHIIGRTDAGPELALAYALGTTLSGLTFAVIVVASRTVWPAIVFHAAGNVRAHDARDGVSSFDMTTYDFTSIASSYIGELLALLAFTTIGLTTGALRRWDTDTAEPATTEPDTT